MLVRAEDQAAVFRLEAGKRRRVEKEAAAVPAVLQAEMEGAGRRSAGAAGDVRILEAPVLQSIPPALAADMLIKGLGPDVFHVDGSNDNTLRRVPDWKWVSDRRLRPSDVLHVPDRIVATLPQNSPHWAQPGGAWSDRSFRSDVLGREMPYRVYLPPKYDAPEEAARRYPVLYLLHGMSGRYDEWSGYGVEEVANELLADGKIGRTIIVLPQGGQGYWMNQDGGTPWGDYVVHDLVQHVDATFRTQPRREARAIGGLSMGAHGALQLALNHPTVFGIAGAHSPSLRTREDAPAYFGSDAGFADRDPITLVREAPSLAPPYIWIDAGRKDFWRPGAEALHEALAERGWGHEWHVLPGEHDGWYWGEHLWEYLQYYSSAFARGGAQVAR
jgi:enterochelin esterase-like enzyme